MNVDMPRQQEGAEMLRRLAEALHPQQEARESEETELEFDAAMTFSDREQLQAMDFEKMSLDELAQAKAAIARLRLPVLDPPLRRHHRIETQEPQIAAATAGRFVRHLGLDEPLQPDVPAFYARDHQRPR